MLILVSYDVSTETSAGRRRLRRVAKTCLNYGQRVQKSVFECKVDAATYELLQAALLNEISLVEDNLRIYRLTEPLSKNVQEFGKFRATDFDAPLMLWYVKIYLGKQNANPKLYPISQAVRDFLIYWFSYDFNPTYPCVYCLFVLKTNDSRKPVKNFSIFKPLSLGDSPG